MFKITFIIWVTVEKILKYIVYFDVDRFLAVE